MAAPIRILIHPHRGFAPMVRAMMEGLQNIDMVVSKTKSVGIASSPAIGRALEDQLQDCGMKFSQTAKSLGVDLVAGRRRRTGTQAKRLQALRDRRARIARLKRAGVRAARYFRTGFSSSVSWGVHAIVISDSQPQLWRAEVARGCSPGSHWKSVDLVLLFADETEAQHTDPAFEAHKLPINYWA